MVKKICPAGQKRHVLMNICILHETESRAPSTKPPLLVTVDQVSETAPAPQANSVMAPSPALWIFVTLATAGSILVLALWFIIYRRTRPSSTPDAEPGQEAPQKTDPPDHRLPSETPGQTEVFGGGAEAPSSCAHLHLGAQSHSTWEEGFTAKHAGKEEAKGLMTRGHRIPLPATELGGTALVTTKTV